MLFDFSQVVDNQLDSSLLNQKSNDKNGGARKEDCENLGVFETKKGSHTEGV